MFEVRLDSPGRARIALIADTSFFGLWSWIAGSGYVGWPAAGWLSAFLCAYLLASSVLLHDLIRASCVAAVAIALAALFAPHGDMQMVWVATAVGRLRWDIRCEKRYIERRLSNTLRHNVIIRSQAQGAREAERATHRRRFSRRSIAELHQFSDAPGDRQETAGARRSRGGG